MKIELDNVSKIIGGNTVLKAITLTMQSGKCYGLNGYNGCGKTMLMRVISGLMRPTQGRVFVDGVLLGKAIDFPPEMGLLIENPSFLGGYSGADNLKMLAMISKRANDTDISCALKRVGLEDAGRKKYRKYSLGMKQRLGIAAAIFEHPSLLILDEPTNALDLDGIEKIKEIIAEEKQRNTLIILASHDRAFLEHVCDVRFQIDGGCIIGREELNK